MSEPIVSVVIPAYNCEGYLAEAVDSAALQKVPLDIIIIDDGSSDGTVAVMESYSENEKVRLLKNEVNMGVSETRNRGVREAKGEYIAFLDADDIWLEDKLEKQLEVINETGCVLCCTARELINKNSESLGKIIPIKENITYKDLLKNNEINCSSVVIKREVALSFPMERDDLHEDYIMWLRILKAGDKAVGINQPLLKYRLTGSGKSGNKLASAKTTFKVYRYMGFGLLRSAWYFSCYALNGVKKYFFGGDKK
jgi:teichuronic acid biosynthesis glycosyltransferase TuaG